MTLKKMPLFDVKNPGRGNFWVNSGRFSTGTEFGPLLTDGHMYLCPDCGGHGLIYKTYLCAYCGGAGEIKMTDERVLPANGGLNRPEASAASEGSELKPLLGEEKK